MKYSIRRLNEEGEIEETGTLSLENGEVKGTGSGVKMIKHLQTEGIRYMKIIQRKRKLTRVLLTSETSQEIMEHLEWENSSYSFVVRID